MSICPKTGKIHNSPKKRYWLVLWLLPITGLLSLIWFLVRVIPKPSRAAYPCQRVAFPLASGFVVWLCGLAGSVVAIRKAKRCLVRTRYTLAAICVAFSIGALWTAISITNPKITFATPPVANAPVGVAKGINPGRVVWVRDPNATDWEGPGLGDGHWWEAGHTDQAVVDQMLSKAIRELTGRTTDAAAWNELFEHFNEGWEYESGEKIAIKVNMVSWLLRGTNRLDENYDIDMSSKGRPDYPSAAPQMMLALLKQLVNVVGVDQADITIGDPTTRFPNQYYDVCHDVFPNVKYLDGQGGIPGHLREPISTSSTFIYWSSHPDMTGLTQDRILTCYTQANYIINMASFKSHNSAAVTFCGKNYYGSFIRYPGESGFYSWHESLPHISSDMGNYRAIVDMMGHPQLGRKVMLFLIDGLYAGQHVESIVPIKLNSDPFDGDWSSSVFASQDPVAIDSVAYDVLWAEPGWEFATHLSAGDDYLHEAAQANNPPSGVYYDPVNAGDVSRLQSLGTHEHWNNFIDKQYSRNLGTGNGIELLMFSSVSDPGPLAGDVDNDKDVDANDLSKMVDYWLIQRQIPSGLVGYWAMDQNDSDTVAADTSGNENHGTLVGDPNWVNGIIDGAIYLDGTDDCVEADIGTTSGEITYSFWFRSNDVSVTKRIVERDWSGGGSFTTAHIDSEIEAIFRLSGGAAGVQLYSGPISSDTWHHIVCLFDGADVFLYVNGELKDTGSQASILADSRNLWMGALNYDFNGTLDDVMVFNKALSLEEVRKLYSLAVDLNRDNRVNMTDIAIMGSDWQKGTGP